jgi:hypothetical protein
MVLGLASVLLSAISSQCGLAHTLPWRAGEPRVKVFGACAKGPCMKRYDFSATKPHRHLGPGPCGVTDSRGHFFNATAKCRELRMHW